MYRETPLQESLPPGLEKAMEAGPYPSNHSPKAREIEARGGEALSRPKQKTPLHVAQHSPTPAK